MRVMASPIVMDWQMHETALLELHPVPYSPAAYVEGLLLSIKIEVAILR